MLRDCGRLYKRDSAQQHPCRATSPPLSTSAELQRRALPCVEVSTVIAKALGPFDSDTEPDEVAEQGELESSVKAQSLQKRT